MQMNAVARSLTVLVAVLGLMLSGLVASPGFAGDDKGLGTPSPSPTTGPGVSAAFGDAWVYRENHTANHERVDLRDDRIAKVQTLHGVNFSVLARVVEQARSPRMSTSRDGVDRGVYQYKIYEYEVVNGRTIKTGNWCIVETVIEWGDGHADRGWMVTTYPVLTNRGSPPRVDGKSYAPAWMVKEFAMGPPNDEVLYW